MMSSATNQASEETHRSVLLPAPVPQINVWARRKSSSSEVAATLPKIAPPSPDKEVLSNKATPSVSQNKENSAVSGLNGSESTKSKAKFSRNEKWVPYADAEIELPSAKPKSRGKIKKKKSTKGKKEDSLESEKTKDLLKKTVSKEKSSKDGNLEISLPNADNEVIDPEVGKLSLNDGTESDVKALNSDDNKGRSNHNYQGKNANFKSRNNYEAQYQNSNYYNGLKFNGNRNSNASNGNRSQMVPPNGFQVPVFLPQPYMNPLYANSIGGGYVNPAYFQSPIMSPTSPYSNPQFERNSKYKNNSSVNSNINTGYSSDISYNDNESAGSKSPSRRGSSLDAQVTLPKVPFLPLQQQYFNSAMMGVMGQQPFYPPPHLMQQPLPLLPNSNQDPRVIAVIRQLEYYFSLENLLKDMYLRGLMNQKTGGVQLSVLLEFNRVKLLIFREKKKLNEAEEEEGIDILRSAIEYIPTLELIDDLESVKLIDDWERWVMSSSEK